MPTYTFQEKSGRFYLRERWYDHGHRKERILVTFGSRPKIHAPDFRLGDAALLVQSLPRASVQLVFTSPPYSFLKEGTWPSWEAYHDFLDGVWRGCFQAMDYGGRLVVNIADEHVPASATVPHQILPNGAEIAHRCRKLGFLFMGRILWAKPRGFASSGGGSAIGSGPQQLPGEFLFPSEHEEVLIFKKPGRRTRSPSDAEKKASRLRDWRSLYTDRWVLQGERGASKSAAFPLELAIRVVRMFSFVGDTVLDPFTGTGTTLLAASLLGRRGIGFEKSPATYAAALDRLHKDLARRRG